MVKPKMLTLALISIIITCFLLSLASLLTIIRLAILTPTVDSGDSPSSYEAIEVAIPKKVVKAKAITSNEPVQIPADVLEYAQQESEAWARDDTLEEAIILYQNLGDWGLALQALQKRDGSLKSSE